MAAATQAIVRGAFQRGAPAGTEGPAAHRTARPARAWPIGLGIDRLMMADSAIRFPWGESYQPLQVADMWRLLAPRYTDLPLTFAWHEPRMVALRLGMGSGWIAVWSVRFFPDG